MWSFLGGLRQRDALVTGALALAVVGSMLAIGGVHPITVIVLSVPTFVATWFVIRDHILSRRSRQVPWPALVAMGLSFYTLLQAVPLPLGILEQIAPSNADVWARALTPFGLASPRWAPLSLDPGASCLEALKWAMYSAIFALAFDLSSRRGADSGIALVFFSGVALALITVCHGLAGATKVFGLYEPHFGVAPWHVSPLLNPNNLAGYLNIAAMAGLGLVVARNSVFPRWVVGLGVAAIVGVDVTSASRGGVLVLPIGAAVFAGVLRWSNRGDSPGHVAQKQARWLMWVALGGGLVLAMMGGTSETWKELYDKNIEKLSSLLWTKELIKDHLWWGIGRGAFESVFPMYRTTPGNVVFTHSENFPTQWIAEWGLPVSLLSFSWFAWFFRPGELGVRRSALAAGAYIGVSILLLQNMMDLALEVPAVTTAVAAVLGALWGDKRRRGARRRDGGEEASSSIRRVGPIIGYSSAALAAIAWIGTLRSSVHDIASDKEAMHAAFAKVKVSSVASVATFRAQLNAVTLRHPADPYFPLLGALVANSARDSSPMPWIHRSLERAALNGRAHALLAHILAERGADDQSLLEVRMAVGDDPSLAAWGAERALMGSHDYDRVMRGVPTGKAGIEMLEAILARLVVPEDDDLRERFGRLAIDRDSQRASPRISLAGVLVRRLRAGDAGACVGSQRKACEREIDDQVEALHRLLPHTSDAEQVRAGFLAVTGKPDEGERLLARRCNEVDDRVNCLYARVSIAYELKEGLRLTEAAKDLLNAVCVNASACAEASTWVGDLMAQRGEWGGASTSYARATREEPTEARWRRLAQSSARIGAHAQALEALRKVVQLRGSSDPAVQAAIADEQAKTVDRLIEK